MLKGEDGLYTKSLNSYTRVLALSSYQAMCMGPVFKLIHLFPFTVSNVTLELIREPMNMRLLLHTDVFAALYTTKVMPPESNNNGGETSQFSGH